MNLSHSISAIDLDPLPGKIYTDMERPWQEEVIYFLLVDRFHDGKERVVIEKKGRSQGFGSYQELKQIYGGTLQGITRNLDYISGLGCTAIWISPVLENNPESYHGYAIRNFLKIDPRFGTEKDLSELVEAAHKKGLRVILDCVINHSGNNWSYRGDEEPEYDRGKTYPFGLWKDSVHPVPEELRDEDFYKKKGSIRNWDAYPETLEGDFFCLKKFRHDESETGLQVQDILFRIYCYWIRQSNCDGFRLDAAKHLGPLAVARFTTRIKEYARGLGKKNFFVFAEIPATDKVIDSFSLLQLSEEEKKVYPGPDTFLDFPLHFLLSKIVLGKEPVTTLGKRMDSRRSNFRAMSKYPSITFLDNHDQIEKPLKQRAGACMNDGQLVAALGILFCLPGIPCLYYGTEQGLSGQGNSDVYIREALFDAGTNNSCLNTYAPLYIAIAELLKIRKEHKALIYGTFEIPSFSSRGEEGQEADPGPLIFLREFLEDRILVAFNPSENEKKIINVKLTRGASDHMIFLFGGAGRIEPYLVKTGYVLFKIELPPLKFIILK